VVTRAKTLDEKLRWPKRPKRGGEPPKRANERLQDQTRKILGTHYASKYRVR
jgi:hypothetical protein